MENEIYVLGGALAVGAAETVAGIYMDYRASGCKNLSEYSKNFNQRWRNFWNEAGFTDYD